MSCDDCDSPDPRLLWAFNSYANVTLHFESPERIPTFLSTQITCLEVLELANAQSLKTSDNPTLAELKDDVVVIWGFSHEYRITFPVGVDTHEPGITMRITTTRLGLHGTPSLIIIDRAGSVRVNAFGRTDDRAFGALIPRLID